MVHEILKIKELIGEKGKLVGLLFNDKLYTNRPPFGGSLKSYLNLFEKHFSNVRMEKCYNSINSRSGRELFIAISNPLK